MYRNKGDTDFAEKMHCYYTELKYVNWYTKAFVLIYYIYIHMYACIQITWSYIHLHVHTFQNQNNLFVLKLVGDYTKFIHSAILAVFEVHQTYDLDQK